MANERSSLDETQTTRSQIVESDDSRSAIEQDAGDFVGKLPDKGSARPRTEQHNDRPLGEEEEEAENHTMSRLLEDSQGRLVFVGDSATLSFLQLIRMIVESVNGPSMFTSDPKRHRIEETQFSINSSSETSQLLPEQHVASILADAFFIHTYAFIDLYDEAEFRADLENAYRHPLDIDTRTMAKMHLVLAIGMCLAIPRPGSIEEEIIEDIRRRFPDQSESYYLVAMRVKASMRETEEVDLWTIQSLVLMAFYMLLRTRRSLAYAYIGTAIRSGFALGLHRDETHVIFSPPEQIERRRLWRTIFVLDRFMSVSLGRPLGISADLASGNTLNPGPIRTSEARLSPTQLTDAAMAAATESAHTMGEILSRIYQEGKVSTRIVQTLSDRCKEWPSKLTPQLHWRNATSDDTRSALAILHCNLLFCHSIVLLTRPLFLYSLTSEIHRSRLHIDPLAKTSKIARFSDACIMTSFHTIRLVQRAYEGHYLPRLNPLSSYCLFTCGLIILANEVARPGRYATAEQSIHQCICILQYCGTLDPHAQEAASVLNNFRDVLRQGSHLPYAGPTDFAMMDIGGPPPDSGYEPDFLGQGFDALSDAHLAMSGSEDMPLDLDRLRRMAKFQRQ